MNKVRFGNNQYCVPSVLSILTGKDTDECARVISSITGKYEITTVYTKDTLKALEKLKFKYQRIDNACDVSLFSAMHLIARTSGMYLVQTFTHSVAVEVTPDHKVLLCDNHTKEPINGACSARLGQKVEEVYLVTELPKPTVVNIEQWTECVKTYFTCKSMSDGSKVIETHTVKCIGE